MAPIKEGQRGVCAQEMICEGRISLETGVVDVR